MNVIFREKFTGQDSTWYYTEFFTETMVKKCSFLRTAGGVLKFLDLEI